MLFQILNPSNTPTFLPVTSFHVFEGAAHGKLRLLKAFGLLRLGLDALPGVCFAKAMGCGRGAAFSIMPDWNRWAIMMECANEDAEATVMKSVLFSTLKNEANNLRSWRLTAFRKKGLWDGRDPFCLEADTGEGEVAVLTRANIPLLQILSFIRHSRKTTEALKAAPGLRFGLGMGELPLIRQATFTIWESDAAMAAYAYKDQRHIAAMQAKRATGMFTEEMFVRFRIQPLQAT